MVMLASGPRSVKLHRHSIRGAVDVCRVRGDGHRDGIHRAPPWHRRHPWSGCIPGLVVLDLEFTWGGVIPIQCRWQCHP